MGIKRKAWELRLESRLDETEGGPGSITSVGGDKNLFLRNLAFLSILLGYQD